MKIGVFDVKVVKRLEERRKEYPLCDSEGNELKSDFKPSTRVYKNKDGVVVTETFRLINGKPLAKLKRTDKVENFEEVDRTEAFDLRVEEFYFCECDALKKHLKDKDKAYRFVYTNGNGYKAYISYLVVYQDNLIMICGFGGLGDLIERARSESVSKKEIVDEKVRANPEELLVAEIKVKKK